MAWHGMREAMGVCGRDTSVAAIATLLAGKLKPNAILTLAMTITNINGIDINNILRAMLHIAELC